MSDPRITNEALIPLVKMLFQYFNGDVVGQDPPLPAEAIITLGETNEGFDYDQGRSFKMVKMAASRDMGLFKSDEYLEVCMGVQVSAKIRSRLEEEDGK